MNLDKLVEDLRRAFDHVKTVEDQNVKNSLVTAIMLVYFLRKVRPEELDIALYVLCKLSHKIFWEFIYET